MYAEHFGFREPPFNNTPDPRFFFSTPDHEEALATLIYTVRERKGFVLLTGETGTGKTLMTRLMLRQLGTRVAFATIHHAVRTPEDLLESICTEFELSVPPGATNTHLVRILHDFLLTQFARNVPVVLVLDEAQNLSFDGFEQLRQIGNLEADDAKLLQIVIVGQPELRDTFATPRLRQLRQRLFRSFHLPALTREYTEQYIRRRLGVVAESPAEVFEPGAIDAIFRHSAGLPRLVNTICDNALLSAYAANRTTVDSAMIDSVAEPLMAGPRPDGRTMVSGHAPGAAVWADAAAFASAQRAGDQVLVDPDAAAECVLEAKAIQGSLVPLLRDARKVTASMEASGGELHQREESLTRLAQSIREMTRDLRAILDRAGESSAVLLDADRQARRTLMAMNGRSRLQTADASNFGNEPRVTEARESSRSTAFAGQPQAAASDSSRDVDVAMAGLRQARDRLAGLRTMERRPGVSTDTGRETTASSAAARLADSVEHLLEAVVAGRADSLGWATHRDQLLQASLSR